MFLSDVSIKRPIFMSMLLLAMILFGVIAYQRLGIDLYPKVEFPVITVVSLLPGADPETIESKVTDVIEEALTAVDSIKHLRSISSESVSVVIIEFDLKKDVNIAYQEVQEKVSSIRGHLPKDLLRTEVGKFDIDSIPIVSIIVSADLPIGKLTHLAKKEIKDRLKQLPNMGRITTLGGQERKIWLSVDREKLSAYQISLEEIEIAIKSHHLDMPAGKVTEKATQYLLKTKGELQSIAEFEDVVVANRKNTSIYFRDIGVVEDGLTDQNTASHLNGHSAIALMIGRQSGTNTVELANNIKKEVAKIKPDLEKRGVKIEIAQDNSIHIERSVEEVHFDLLFGGCLAIMIVLIFLRNARSSFICALALPTAVLGTFAFMATMGFTQNMMTLLALSIAIGLLIDDAIVVQENIIRHIEDGLKPIKAASLATKKIALAVLATTFTVVAVFVPVAFMNGIVGRFFYEFGFFLVGFRLSYCRFV